MFPVNSQWYDPPSLFPKFPRIQGEHHQTFSLSYSNRAGTRRRRQSARNDTVGPKPVSSAASLSCSCTMQPIEQPLPRQANWEEKESDGRGEEAHASFAETVIIGIGSAIVGEMYSSSSTRKKIHVHARRKDRGNEKGPE